MPPRRPYDSLSIWQRRAFSAAKLRAQGQVVKRELLEDPQPDDLITRKEAAAIAGIGLRRLDYRRAGRRNSQHPIPPEYLRKSAGKGAGKGASVRHFYRRGDILDWVDELEAERMGPVVLNWYERFMLRKLLRDLPDYGERRAHEIYKLLAVPLQLTTDEEEEHDA